VQARGGERLRRLFLGALPILVLLPLYDSLRFVVPLGLSPDRVLGCSMDRAERLLFGVHAGGAVLTPNEWLAARLACPALDLLCAVPYGAYLPVMVGQFLYLLARRPADARRFGWLSLGTHLLGFMTYALLPAAPPWYVHAHGCAIDLATRSSPAALARVDAMLGISYFHDLYGKGVVVFGALPSLHVTYPLYGLLVMFRGARWPSRLVLIAYAALMPFAAVYLGHHYVIDVLLGVAYTLVVFAVVARALPAREETAGTTEHPFPWRPPPPYPAPPPPGPPFEP
jgi:membrane-associated phospholipid phosphatase